MERSAEVACELQHEDMPDASEGLWTLHPALAGLTLLWMWGWSQWWWHFETVGCQPGNRERLMMTLFSWMMHFEPQRLNVIICLLAIEKKTTTHICPLWFFLFVLKFSVLFQVLHVEDQLDEHQQQDANQCHRRNGASNDCCDVWRFRTGWNKGWSRRFQVRFQCAWCSV